MEIYCTGSVLLLSGISVCMDLRSGKIPNILILTGWGMGLFYHLTEWGWLGVLTFTGEAGFPMLIWGIIYYFRMIGAADIKLFSVLGAFLGIARCSRLMLYSVLIGGVLAAVLMVIRGNFYWRLLYFQSYLSGVLRREQWHSYREGENKESTFHFTIPVFLSVLLLLGGSI